MGKLSDRLKRYTPKSISERIDPDFAQAVQEAIKELEDVDELLSYEKHGKWKTDELPTEVSIEKFICLRCSNCNQFAPIGKYCRECGARMENG